MKLTEEQLADLVSTLEESHRLLSAAAGPFSRNTLPDTYIKAARRLSDILVVLKQE